MIMYLIKKYGNSKHMSVVADSAEPFRVLQTFIFKSAFIGRRSRLGWTEGRWWWETRR